MSTKMICRQCETSLKPFKNGVTVIETSGNPPRPYKIWEADMWECPKCKMGVVTDFGLRPIATLGDEDFYEILEKIGSGDEMIVYDHKKGVAAETVGEDDIDMDSPHLIKGARGK